MTETEKLISMLSALSNKTRWDILRFLAASKEGLVILTLSKALNIASDLVAHHCQKLYQANLIEKHEAGKYTHYTICDASIKLVLGAVFTLTKVYKDENWPNAGRAVENNPSVPIGERKDSPGNNAG